jgi:hypothetical protein
LTSRVDVEGSVLRGLGFREGCISETIVCTINSDKSFNVAPMGLRLIGNDLIISPFVSTRTCKNLRMNRRACVNLVSEPEVYLFSALKNEGDWSTRISINEDMSVSGSEALIYLDFTEEPAPSKDRATFTGKVRSTKILSKTPRVFSRGKSLAIEAVILATKIEYLTKHGDISEAEPLIRRLFELHETIKHVSQGDASETKVSSELIRLFGGGGRR